MDKYIQKSYLPDPVDRITNVASVSQRSPFRYPGGKTWLVPRVKLWIRSLASRPKEFIEPFAGGAIVGLTIAAERLADKIKLVELDEGVASVWETIINDDTGGEWLANQIVSFNFTETEVQEVLSSQGISIRSMAFQTIVKNRVNRGGILAPGAGRLKSGENGKGLSSRWYPETLSKRILDIVNAREFLTFINGDGIEILQQYQERHDAAFFIDPPYTASKKHAGSRLYVYSEMNHSQLFQIVSRLKGNFLMTYENAEEVRELAAQHNFDVQPIAMKNTHHNEMTELLIGRDLGWIR